MPAAATIRDGEGHVLGRHEGVHRFTIGQRKGLGLSSGVPLYVVGIDAGQEQRSRSARARRSSATRSRPRGVNWMSGETPPRRSARHRAHPLSPPGGARDDHAASTARGCTSTFDEPQTADHAGQAVVFYDGDVVVGGGWID